MHETVDIFIKIYVRTANDAVSVSPNVRRERRFRLPQISKNTSFAQTHILFAALHDETHAQTPMKYILFYLQQTTEPTRPFEGHTTAGGSTVKLLI